TVVAGEGFEPSTFGLWGGFWLHSYLVDQTLAALAKVAINVIQSQFGHSQSALVTNRAFGLASRLAADIEAGPLTLSWCESTFDVLEVPLTDENASHGSARTRCGEHEVNG